MRTLNDILNDMNIIMEADSRLFVEFTEGKNFEFVSREDEFYGLIGSAYLGDDVYSITEGLFSCVEDFYDELEKVYNVSSTEKEFFEKIVKKDIFYG